RHDEGRHPDGVTALRDDLASAGLAVRGVLAAARAELRHLEPVGVVPTVLLGDVVALLALRARQGDLGADVGALGHGATCSRKCRWWCCRGGSGSGARSRDVTIMSRAL